MAANTNRIRKTRGERLFDIFNILFMCLVIIVMVLPMIHVLSISLSDGQESIKGGFFLYPRGLNFAGYQTVLKDPALTTSYLYTIFYCLGSMVFTLFFTSMTAYPLSIAEFRLKKGITIFLTITMFVSGGMVPTYLLIRNLGLVNNVLVMMLPFCVGAYNVILFRTFFTGIPPQLREAAIIDGASEMQVLFNIILPSSKAIFATIGLFTLVGKWNDWFTALLYLRDSQYPLQMVLRKILFNTVSMAGMDPSSRALFTNNKVTGENIKMAAIIITVLPIMCIYPFLQKYFAKGVFVGTVKG